MDLLLSVVLLSALNDTLSVRNSKKKKERGMCTILPFFLRISTNTDVVLVGESVCFDDRSLHLGFGIPADHRRGASTTGLPGVGMLIFFWGLRKFPQSRSRQEERRVPLWGGQPGPDGQAQVLPTRCMGRQGEMPS